MGLVSLLVYGGTQVLEGRLTLGDLMMFLFCLTLLLEPLSTLATGWAAAQESLAQLDRVLGMLSEPQEMRSSSAVVVKKHEVLRNLADRGRVPLSRFGRPGVEGHRPGDRTGRDAGSGRPERAPEKPRSAT